MPAKKQLETLLEKYQSNSYPAMLDHLGEHLGVSADSCRALALGWAPIVEFKKGPNFQGWWVIPERDEDAVPVGLSLRSQDDVKVMFPGSKHGLIYAVNPDHERGGADNGSFEFVRTMDAGVNCPVCQKPDGCIVSNDDPHDPRAVGCIRVKEGSVKIMGKGSLPSYLHILKPHGKRSGAPLMPSEDPVVIVEGFSDTAAVHDLGLVGVGRPSNLACMDMLANLVRGRSVIIIGENDKKPDGKFPGREGAVAAFQVVKKVCRDVVWMMPPEHIKDLRVWKVKYGLTREELLAYAKEKGQDKADAPDAGIVIEGGQINRDVKQSQRLLLDSGEPIFVRNNHLIRTLCTTQSDVEKMQQQDGITRQPGSIVTLPVTRLWLVRRLATRGTFFQQRGKGLVPIDPPEKIAEHILDAADESPFPQLRAVVTTPTIRRDGSLLQTPGYDRASHLIYAPNTAYPLIPDEPTRDDAIAALSLFDPIFSGFPFVRPADRTVHYAAMLAAVVRHMLRTAPLFGYNAPAPGTGKSLLGECIGTLMQGVAPALINLPNKDEELEKRLDSAVYRGDPIIVLDNVSRALYGDRLCSLISNPTVAIRVLGKTEVVNCDVSCLILANGNNLIFRDDLCRRVLVCNLDANMERPDLRSFDFDPVKVCRDRRGELVAAALTMLRAFIVAGRPLVKPLTPFGSFTDFDLIRGTLVWLGMADPCETRLDVFKGDDSRESLVQTLSLWHGVIGDKPVTLRQIVQQWDHPSNRSRYDPLIAALKDVTGQSDERGFNAKLTGSRLRRFKGMIVSGLKLTLHSPNRDGVCPWSVARVAPPPVPVRERNP